MVLIVKKNNILASNLSTCLCSPKKKNLQHEVCAEWWGELLKKVVNMTTKFAIYGYQNFKPIVGMELYRRHTYFLCIAYVKLKHCHVDYERVCG
jgi:hypothetical protein